jgi:cytochrome c peroxidase
MAGINMHTWTGWGSVPYWNAFVANLEMHGSPGTFFDPRLDDRNKFPIAAANGFDNVRPKPGQEDRISPTLPALQFYQLAIKPPQAPAGTFDAGKAAAGKMVFENQAKCETCHVGPTFTEPGWNMHTAQEIGIDDIQASRSPDDRYRTTPLAGRLFWRTKGFYHDGRFATLQDVVNHYNTTMNLGLNAGQMSDLVEYLKSI